MANESFYFLGLKKKVENGTSRVKAFWYIFWILYYIFINGVGLVFRHLKNSLRTFSSAPHASESFLSGSNTIYVEKMHELWKKDENSVHASWKVYFEQVQDGAGPGSAFMPPPSIQQGVGSGGGGNDALGLSYLIRAYQVMGHQAANLDPLGLAERKDKPDYKTYGFTEKDMSRKIQIPQNLYVVGLWNV